MRPPPIIRAHPRDSRFQKKGNAGPESIRGRHLVDVQQRLNCALPSHFSELWFLSIPKSSRHVVNSEEFTDLAVDLCKPDFKSSI
jgi:hypothetical protein